MARVIVVMPAYNAAKTVESTYRDIPPGVVDHVILVDDVSRDNTVEVAKKLGLEVVIHVQNRGYGGNQKTCYIEALRNGAEIIVMLHPDYQYDSKRISELISPIIKDRADVMLGSRILGGDAIRGGMPLYKYISNRFLTLIENIILRQSLSEYHTGLRAYSRKVLEEIPFVLNSDGFLFDTEILFQARVLGFRVDEIGIPTRYFADASSVGFKAAVIYGLGTLWTALKYLLFKLGLARPRQFTSRLREVISPYHWDLIRGAAEGDLAAGSALRIGRSDAEGT